LWNPRASNFVLAVTGTAPWPESQAKPFNRLDLHCWMHALATGPHHQHALFLDRGRRLQISVNGNSLRERVCLSPVAAPVGAGITRRAELVRALDQLVAQGTLPQRVHRTESGIHRLLFILLALDGARSRLPLRELARILHGEVRTREDWKQDGRAIRAQIGRAVARGEWLAAGGYRTLLE